MAKKVRIKKASYTCYADRVGEIFEVEPFAGGYASTDGKFFFEVDDCVDVNDINELLEITANLTRRVFELERENKRLRDDVTETLGTITDLLRRRDRRIEEINDKAEMLIDDVALLDERTEGLR